MGHNVTSSDRGSRWLLTALGLLASCSTTEQIASACPGADCALPAAQTSDESACTIQLWDGGFTITSPLDDMGFHSQCLPRPLAQREDGTVDCDVEVSLDRDEVTKQFCRDVVWADLERREGSAFCRMPQISTPDISVPLPAHPTFYYDEDSDELEEECGRGGQRLAWTLGAYNVSSEHPLTVKMACRSALRWVDHKPFELLTEQCELPSQQTDAADFVGQACRPRLDYIPQGFDQSEAYLDSASAQCGTGMCMVFHIRGRVLDGCIPEQNSCAPEDLIPERVACTCRCAADGPGDAELCTCPDGFSCVPMVADGPAAGSYCVDSSIVTG